MADVIWLEIDKKNEAIMSYYLQQPNTPSSQFDYIEATEEELVYLNALERDVFTPGTVTTLSDLQDHRARVQAAKATAAQPSKPASKALRQPSKPAREPVSTTPKPSTTDAKARFIAALKQHRTNK